MNSLRQLNYSSIYYSLIVRFTSDLPVLLGSVLTVPVFWWADTQTDKQVEVSKIVAMIELFTGHKGLDMLPLALPKSKDELGWAEGEKKKS